MFLFHSFKFYFFGIIDTILTSVSIIWLSLFMRDSLKRKKIIYRYFTKGWGKRLFQYTGSTISITGKKHIDPNQNYLIVVNHQSNFDIYILIGMLNLPLCFLSKIQNFRIPLVGSVMYRMGCIAINRASRGESLKSIYQTAERYDEGMSIVIYPEGTRSHTGDILPFKTGFIHIIEHIETPCYLLPVTLSGTRNIQEKKKFTINNRRIKLDIAAPILVEPKELKKTENKTKLINKLEEVIRKPYQKDF